MTVALDAGGAVATSLRERKKSATRLSLRRAALQLTILSGYTQVTVEAIAELAGVSPRTFFNYFPSKDAAVLGYDPERNERLCAALLQRPQSEGPLEALAAVVLVEIERVATELHEVAPTQSLRHRMMKATKADPHLLAAYVQNTASVESVLANALAKRLGSDRDDLYPATVVAAVLAAARAAIIQTGFEGPVERTIAAARSAVVTLAGGCAHSLDNSSPRPRVKSTSSGTPEGSTQHG